MYLILGGQGKIGLELVKYLIQTHDARVLVVGRRSNHDALLQYGSNIRYEACDVCDFTGISQAVEVAKQRWGIPLHGVLHLADDVSHKLLGDETPETFMRGVRSKTEGTIALYRLLREQHACLFVAFSSLNSFFGGTGAASYSTACAFLESYFRHIENDSGITCRCFHWSAWETSGEWLDDAKKAALFERGFRIISPQKGIEAFRAALETGEPQLLIGLDPSGFEAQRFFSFGPCVASDSGFSQEWIDLRPPAEGGHDTPDLQMSDLERTIVEIWSQLLGRNDVGPDLNFFDAGGQSLLAANLCVRLEREVGVRLRMLDLLKYPTVRMLARFVSGKVIAAREHVPERVKSRLERTEELRNARTTLRAEGRAGR